MYIKLDIYVLIASPENTKGEIRSRNSKKKTDNTMNADQRKTNKRTNSDLQTTSHNEHWKCNNQMVMVLHNPTPTIFRIFPR